MDSFAVDKHHMRRPRATPSRGRRNALVAAVLNLLFPPLGFVYVREFGYAIAYLVIFVSLTPVALWTRIIYLPFGYLTVAAVLICLWSGSVAFAAVMAHRQRSIAPPRWYVYLLFIVATSLVYGGYSTFKKELFGETSFRIKSGSMMPIMVMGDFILVDTTSYDRDTGKNPSPGDVVVFSTSDGGALFRAKRVIGLPGDHITYHNKILFINGNEIEQTILGTYEGGGVDASMTGASLRREIIGERAYGILIQEEHPAIEVNVVVPEDHYFVLGDNRDNSLDSRYFGAVHRDDLVGEVVLVWMHFDGLVVEGSWPNFKISQPHVEFSRYGMPVR